MHAVPDSQAATFPLALSRHSCPLRHVDAKYHGSFLLVLEAPRLAPATCAPPQDSAIEMASGLNMAARPSRRNLFDLATDRKKSRRYL